MPHHLLPGLLGLVSAACTLTMFVLAIRVIVPRRRERRPIRVPLTIGLTIGAVGLIVAIVNLVAALSS